jgi:hypothetical protein
VGPVRLEQPVTDGGGATLPATLFVMSETQDDGPGRLEVRGFEQEFDSSATSSLAGWE